MDLESQSLDISPKAAVRFFQTETGRKYFRYGAVSAIAILVSLCTLGVCYGLLRWSKITSQIAAVIISTIPSYELNRRWVWLRDGKSDLRTEVLPFWVVSVIQFVISLWVINWAGHIVEQHTQSHLLRTLGIQSISLLTYGVMWVGKFILLNKVLFADKPVDDRTAELVA